MMRVPSFYIFTSLLFLLVHAQFPPLTFPPLTGPHKIGTTTLYLPNNKTSPPRDLMVSLFYPTLPNVNGTKYPLEAVYDPYYAGFLENILSLPPGLASLLISSAHSSAPLLLPRSNKNAKCKTPYPILLFSPGYGGSRLDYTATLSNIASQGFIVIGVDHPFDTAFITYPNGRTEFNVPEDLGANETRIVELVNLRVGDLKFVVDSLRGGKGEELVKRGLPGWRGRLEIDEVGVFGHSLGGAASASAMLSSPRTFTCGANLDGALWGLVTQKGVKNPFLILSSEKRNSTNDPSWASFWRASKSPLELELAVKGSEHGSFSDQAYLFGVLVQLGVLPAVDAGGLGTIDGGRVLVVESAYLTALFNYCFTGKKDKLLKGSSGAFPEVVFFPK